MEFDKEVDATGLRCPLPILRCKKGLSDMENEQVLKITATDSGAVKDFDAFCKQTGHEILDQNEAEGIYTFFIKKHVSP